MSTVQTNNGGDPRERASTAAGTAGEAPANPAERALPPIIPPPDGLPPTFDFGPIKRRLESAVKDHPTARDAWLFNGGTVLVLLLSAFAALFSSKIAGEDYTWVGAVLSALAGVLVAMERALAFGARWRFHHEMRNGYLSLIDMIDFAAALPPGPEKQKYIRDIWTALYALRSRESAIPGSGSAPA